MPDYKNIDFENFDWDAPIDIDSIPDEDEYETLPAGDYNYEVLNYNRSRYTPKAGSKIKAPCDMITFFFHLTDGEHDGNLRNNFYINQTSYIFLQRFLKGCGALTGKESLSQALENAVGKTGICKVKNVISNGNTYANIDKFYPSTFSVSETDKKDLPW